MSQLKESQHLHIPLKDIEIATKHFEESECIGKGGYGRVYKGELLIAGKQTTVAVKRLNENLGQGLKEFLTEIQLLSGQTHPNLISLLGYCDEAKEKIIVYEYADRGSLDRYIVRKNTTQPLTWLERLKICLDAARGLEFLHNHFGKHQSIIHRDVKSANILIDQNWVAKISDLGLSKLSLAGLNRSSVITHACGTPGYCEPEYIITGIVKKESDVYSFGMVLFEVLSGRLCQVIDRNGFILSAKLVKDCYENNNLDEIVDPGLRDQMSPNSLKQFSAIAYRCLSDDRDRRPSMRVVVKELEELVRIQIKLKKEKEEQLMRKEKGDSNLYRIIKVARDEDLLKQIGKYIYFDLVDYDKVHSFRIRKHLSFTLFKEDVAIEFGIAVQYQRFWLMAQRNNQTYRLNRPLTPQEEAQPIGQLRESSKDVNNSELKLFLEVEFGQDLRPIPLPEKTGKEILLFFKLYDPLKEELRYVGRLYVKVTERPREVLARMNELAGYTPDEEIELFEEFRYEPHVMCEQIDKRLTFQGSMLKDGDIICFQKPLEVEHVQACRYPDVPSFLEYVCSQQIRLKAQDLKKKENAEAHLYRIIKVACDEDLREQIGKHIYFDLVDHDKVRSFRFRKDLSFALFKEDVAMELGIAVQYQRFWLLAQRQNHTYRLNRPLTPQEEAQPVGHLKESSKYDGGTELKLFLEVELGWDLRPIRLPEKTKQKILLFFKLYDPLKEDLRYVGRLFVNVTENPRHILAQLNELAGYAPDEELELFEEIKFLPSVMCEHIDKSVTFRLNQLEDGDIICFQKQLRVEHSERCRYPDIPSFLEYIRNHHVYLL